MQKPLGGKGLNKNLAKAKVENLRKQLFHLRLLDMRLFIANLALHASLAIYHLISNGIIVKYFAVLFTFLKAI